MRAKAISHKGNNNKKKHIFYMLKEILNLLKIVTIDALFNNNLVLISIDY